MCIDKICCFWEPYFRCVCSWECKASPTITPFELTTAAPVSSQLVSMPRMRLLDVAELDRGQIDDNGFGDF